MPKTKIEIRQLADNNGGTSIAPLTISDAVMFEDGDTLNDKMNNIINVVYPVGSIYMSVNSVSPATLFGGTWEQIEDTFLLAAGSTYASGSTGGEAEHTLITNELPKIQGNLTSVMMDDGAGISIGGVFSASTPRQRSWSGTSGNAVRNISLNFGNNQPHNNMPPYLAVYIWKRTA